MKILRDDPRLTAYALGEIEDAEECAMIEKAVAESSELQAEVESIRSLGTLLSDGFAAEPAPELSELEKARFEQMPEPAATPSVMARLIRWPMVAGIAAVLVLGLILIPQVGEVGRMTYEDARTLQAESTQFAVQEAESTPVPALNEVSRVVRQDVVANEAPVATSLSSVVTTTLPEEVPAKEKVAATSPEVAVPTSTVGDLADRQIVAHSNFSVANEPSQDEVVGAVDYFASPPSPMAGASRMMVAEALPTARNTEGYDLIEEVGFRSPMVAPLSTFSIDVDTASYANVRRYLNQGQFPPADAVRIEELINYFPYADPVPTESFEEGGDPFAVHVALTTAPWNEAHRLLRIALKGYEMPWEARPASNLVFLLDVSGSMNQPNKLPLLKETLELLVRRLDERDRVAVVVYAGASGLVLPSTTANNRETIEHAMSNLKAGGSTNAGAGIELAYKTARKHFIEGGNNRVILCTDGDFNVGQTNRGELAAIAEKQAEAGVSLTILGFGMGNLKDGMLETLSNKGKGSYAYIDSESEARKVFLQDLASNIFKIAKDVKIQVELNPSQVASYRLIGYENRRLKAEDFSNDAKQAGDIGPGHSIVALYEIVPAGVGPEVAVVDPLRYQEKPVLESIEGELATVKLRYKQPEGSESQLITKTVLSDNLLAFSEASVDVQFSAAVAAFGLRLRESESVKDFDYAAIERIAAGALGLDPGGHRSEFIELVGKAGEMTD
ncbi:MAG: von Willebrand factor type A domain-containing protein [Verrucomicrobiota bacterium]